MSADKKEARAKAATEAAAVQKKQDDKAALLASKAAKPLRQEGHKGEVRITKVLPGTDPPRVWTPREEHEARLRLEAAKGTVAQAAADEAALSVAPHGERAAVEEQPLKDDPKAKESPKQKIVSSAAQSILAQAGGGTPGRSAKPAKRDKSDGTKADARKSAEKGKNEGSKSKSSPKSYTTSKSPPSKNKTESIPPTHAAAPPPLKLPKDMQDTAQKRRSSVTTLSSHGSQQISESPRHVPAVSDELRIWKQMAKAGDPEALCHLAGCYFYGEEGFPQDDQKAVAYFSSAAKRGHPVALCCLALAYLDGKGVPQNRPTAAAYFKQAAALGDANAHCCLGKMHLRGEGVVRSLDLAVKHLMQAHRLGDAAATRYLAQIKLDLAQGRTPGLPQDPHEAVEMLQAMAGQSERHDLMAGLSQGGRGTPPVGKSRCLKQKWEPTEKWIGRQTSGGGERDDREDWRDPTPTPMPIQEVVHRRHLPEPMQRTPKAKPAGPVMRF